MRIGLHPEAASELEFVANRLDDDWFGLGERFLQSYRRVTENLKQHPEAYAPVLDNGKSIAGVRWIKLDNNMRYKVIYKYYPDRELIYVVAIAHFKQKPLYWFERMNDLSLG